MRKAWVLAVSVLLGGISWSQETQSTPSLPIYNQGFAIVRQSVPLHLTAGVNDVSFDNVTSFLEPDSVVLRDPAGKVRLNVLEQNYRTDVASQANLLHAYEGKEIEFEYGTGQMARGRIIRAGSTCGGYGCYAPNGSSFNSEVIVEVNDKIEFGLPGKPIFPALGNERLLTPALNWQLQSDRAGLLDAEISYITYGLSWEASYNVVVPEVGDLVDLVGWITLQNNSGHTFQDARLQLMAGDVNKVAPQGWAKSQALEAVASAAPMLGSPGGVKETAFDEYHLYTLERPSTVEKGESKQIEFLTATGIPSKRIYVYDGYQLPDQLRNNWDYQFQQQSVGLTNNKHVYIMREFRNSEADHLGKPLPAGTMRFYRRDSEGRLQFIGENRIQHTPKDERLRIYTGNAFDLTAERTRTEFRIDGNQRWIDESYQIKLRNHKKEPVEVQVVEHLYRCDNWTISAKSDSYVKKDSHTAEFTAKIPADGEQTVTYDVHYTW